MPIITQNSHIKCFKVDICRNA